MKTIQTHAHYIEWLSAEQMHNASKQWQSELEFTSDEHLFFEDLITTFTSQLIASKRFSDTNEIIDAINRSQKQNNALLEAIKRHENELQVMVDGVDELKKENAYTRAHKELIATINDFLKDYKSLKIQLFEIVKNIRKEEKQSRLIDRK
jgi:hypothetical protein